MRTLGHYCANQTQCRLLCKQCEEDENILVEYTGKQEEKQNKQKKNKQKTPLPYKGLCKVLQCAVFTLSTGYLILVFTSLEIDREIPAVGCCAGSLSFLVCCVVVLGFVLPKALSPLSASRKMGLIKTLLKAVKF